MEYYYCECGNELDEDDENFCAACSEDPYEYDDGIHFADPGGESALRAATENNPRNCSCPTCGAKDVLTPADVAQGYQCNRCADAEERGW